MKKLIVFAVVLGLLVPTLALAAAEFSLGGFVKLDAFWDSVQQGKNMNTVILRDNSLTGHHGRMKFTAQGSRFNFTIKGPKLWGAQTSGFMEMDFDISEQGATAAGVAAVANNASASNNYTPRLRHAMFRFNWPETELLFGQYWSMFCEWYPELVEDGPYQGTGAPTARLPQIRVSQKFLGWGEAALLIGSANAVNNGQVYSTLDTSGQSAETPQVQAKLQYAQDLWGKAAFYGKPTPFTAKITAGWQRSNFAQNLNLALRTFGQNTWSNNLTNNVGGGVVTNHQMLDPWMVMGTVFVPVIPTHSANLAGTASILTQWWLGQGVEAFGFAGVGNMYKFNNNRNGLYTYDAVLQPRFGGYAQAQYYFTNHWFISAAYGLSKSFGFSQADTSRWASRGTAAQGVNQPGYTYAFNADMMKTWQQANVALWYRPIQAIKFGLEYAYGYNNYFQNTAGGAAAGAVPFTFYAPGAVQNTGNVGNAHRVEFVGIFYF